MNITDKNILDTRLNVIIIGVALFWSVLIVVLAGWSYRESYSSTFQTALSAAGESFSKDLVYRRWATLHGGVYAPITPETPPNPYLSNIPERDINTPSGKKLTLINPAYMTRQVHELAKKTLGVQGHITSLKPIRPENAPDEWERRALQALEGGRKEVSSLEPLGKENYLRLMRPLIAEAGCLKCHATQGYKVGDIRGGISVSLPWRPFREALRSQLRVIILAYAGIWVIGILGLYLGKNKLQNYLSARKQAEEALIEKSKMLLESEERNLTAEALRESETRLSTIFKNDPTGIFIVHEKTRIIYDVNDSALETIGLPKEDVVGKVCHRFLCPSEIGCCPICDLGQGVDRSERVLLKPDGIRVPILKTVVPIKLKGENYLLESFIDITERKQAEENIRRLNERISTATRSAQVGIWDWDVVNDRLIWDDQMYVLYGLNKDDFDGAYKAWLKGLHPDDRIFCQEETKRALSGEKDYDTEFRIVWPDRTVHYLKAKGEVIRGADGKALRMIGVNFDITETKQSEERITEQLQELQRWQDVMLGREDRMLELKKEINKLLARTGQPLRYPSVEEDREK
jgi:PAS domain S-box-containing protein